MTESKPVTFTLSGDPKYRLLGTFTRYSSWTARAVTVLEYFKIDYTATYVTLPEVKTISKSGLVPILVVPQGTIDSSTSSSSTTDLEINDSLAICEFLAESHPDRALWPRDPVLRALARSAAAEMHSGFTNLRTDYNTNFVARYEGIEKVPVSAAATKEIERVLKIWDRARQVTKERLGEGGEDEGFLFGKFGIVDAFFWPVLWRLRSYALPLTAATPAALAWMATMWSDPTLQALGRDYFRQAADPRTAIEKYDACFTDVEGVKYGRFEEDWVFDGKAKA